MEELTFHQKRDWIGGLLIACSFGTALDTCPATEIRKLPVLERLKLVNSMEDKQIDQIIIHHQRCMRKREGIN